MKLFATTCLTLLAGATYAVDVKLYGQINKGMFVFDDGATQEFTVLDNILSSTRMGVKGEQNLDNGLTAGVVYEMEMVNNSSYAATQNTAANAAATPLPTTLLQTRHAHVGLAGDFGAVHVGRLGSAVDSVLSLNDMAGAADVMGPEYRFIGGGMKFRNANGTLSAFSINQFTENQYSNRVDAVRYTTPVWNGLSAKGALAQAGDADMALNFEGLVFGDIKTKASAGFWANNNTSFAANSVDKKYYGIISAKDASTGLAGTLVYTQVALANAASNAEDPNSVYAKLSYAKNAYEVAADYGITSHYQSVTAPKSELTTFGLAGQYQLVPGVSAGVLFRQYQADVTGSDLDNMNLYGVNLRMKF